MNSDRKFYIIAFLCLTMLSSGCNGKKPEDVTSTQTPTHKQTPNSRLNKTNTPERSNTPFTIEQTPTATLLPNDPSMNELRDLDVKYLVYHKSDASAPGDTHMDQYLINDEWQVLGEILYSDEYFLDVQKISILSPWVIGIGDKNVEVPPEDVIIDSLQFVIDAANIAKWNNDDLSNAIYCVANKQFNCDRKFDSVDVTSSVSIHDWRIGFWKMVIITTPEYTDNPSSEIINCSDTTISDFLSLDIKYKKIDCGSGEQSTWACYSFSTEPKITGYILFDKENNIGMVAVSGESVPPDQGNIKVYTDFMIDVAKIAGWNMNEVCYAIECVGNLDAGCSYISENIHAFNRKTNDPYWEMGIGLLPK